jgi:DNA repair protein SbcD/Mre11
MITLLHFADAHIDMARQGRRDPETGLPVRVLDFLHALDTIVDTAVAEKVDMVIFAGDAYRDRTPAPTYQREWGKRIMRLSEANIQTILVVGNHDVSPASGRAHTLQEFDTLHVPNIHVVSKPCLLGPNDLNGLPVQVIGIPWLNRSGLAASLSDSDTLQNIDNKLEARITRVIEEYFNQLDPKLPAILTSHISVQGASYGNERSVMLGKDLVLTASLVKDKRLDYVALGHIHKPQNLNPDGHPPVIYPGSIERVDFGEIDDQKSFIIATIEKGKRTNLKTIELKGRPFISRSISLDNPDSVQAQIIDAIPEPDIIKGSLFRLIVSYPRDWEAMIDETAIRRAAEAAFEFHFTRRPLTSARLRIPGNQAIATLGPAELLDLYWKTTAPETSDLDSINQLAGEIIQMVETESEPTGSCEGDLL